MNFEAEASKGDIFEKASVTIPFDTKMCHTHTHKKNPLLLLSFWSQKIQIGIFLSWYINLIGPWFVRSKTVTETFRTNWFGLFPSSNVRVNQQCVEELDTKFERFAVRPSFPLPASLASSPSPEMTIRWKRLAREMVWEREADSSGEVHRENVISLWPAGKEEINLILKIREWRWIFRREALPSCPSICLFWLVILQALHHRVVYISTPHWQWWIMCYLHLIVS